MRKLTSGGIVIVLALALLALTVVPRPSCAQDRATYSRRSDVVYGRKSGLALTMEVFTPNNANGRGVVWIVSSGGQSSRDMTLQSGFERRFEPLLARGYVVFAAIHSTAPRFQLQDFVADAKRAVQFVRANASQFGVDPQRLALAGSSSGGFMALAAAMNPNEGNTTAVDAVDRQSGRVAAVACFFPPTDFANYGQDGLDIGTYLRQAGAIDPSFQFFDEDPKTGMRTLITEQARIVALLTAVSPVSHVNGASPPTFLIHGDQDRAVPIQQSRRLYERLQSANVKAKFVVREGKGHAYPGWEADSVLLAEWFDSTLR